MNQLKTRQMPKAYTIFWCVLTAAYTLWLAGPMRGTILNTYETASERTVDGYLYNDVTGFVGHHGLFPIWVILSALTLLAYILYLKKILYANELGKAAKLFCQVVVILGCVYLLGYALLDAPNSEGEMASMSDKLKYVTASMIGLVWPWLFKLWGILGAAALFTNIMYCYRKFEFNSKLGVIMGSIGAAAIYMTINVPSFGEDIDFTVPRCIMHWTGSLLFAVCIAAPLVIFLFQRGRRVKGKLWGAFWGFAGILALMVVLLITVGKSAMIENLPMIAGFVLLYMLNFTTFFDEAIVEA